MNSHSDLADQLRGTDAHLEPAEVLAFTRFLDSARLIEEALARDLDEHHGMSIREYEILIRLDAAGNEMRLAELADLCVFSNPELTQTLVRLEDRGWIGREKAVGDGRGVVAHLLPSGAAALVTAVPLHTEIIRDRLLARWGAEDIATIGRAMEASARRLRELRT